MFFARSYRLLIQLYFRFTTETHYVQIFCLSSLCWHDWENPTTRLLRCVLMVNTIVIRNRQPAGIVVLERAALGHVIHCALPHPNKYDTVIHGQEQQRLHKPIAHALLSPHVEQLSIHKARQRHKVACNCNYYDITKESTVTVIRRCLLLLSFVARCCHATTLSSLLVARQYLQKVTINLFE